MLPKSVTQGLVLALLVGTVAVARPRNLLSLLALGQGALDRLELDGLLNTLVARVHCTDGPCEKCLSVENVLALGKPDKPQPAPESVLESRHITLVLLLPSTLTTQRKHARTSKLASWPPMWTITWPHWRVQRP